MNTLVKPIRHQIRISQSLLLLSLCFSSLVAAETVIVPIKLDYSLLQQLMLSQLFNTPDRTTEIVHDPAHCNEIFLSDPRLREQKQKLEIRTHVKAKLGTDIFGTCTSLFFWEGDATFLTKPIILPEATSVKLKIINTRLYNRQGEMISSGRLWNIADSHFQSLLGRYQIDLSPSIRELNKLLPKVLSQRSAHQIKGIVDSIKLATIHVRDSGIDVAISLLIDKLPQQSPQPEALLTTQEMQQWEAKWKMMDAMLTFAVKHYAITTDQQELRETLLEILLDARYQLQDALTKPSSRIHDPVRHWFINSWERLSPVIQKISLETPDQDSLLIISLLTATNALKALDQLGPSFGLDISADGLRRMARMIDNQPGLDPLQYEEDIDPELQRLFQMPSDPEIQTPRGIHFNFLPFRAAWAKTNFERLNRWVPKKQELSEYLPMVHDLLIHTAINTVKNDRLDASIAALYEKLVLTTAWQESCWRQYTIKQKKVVPLRSDTGDTGLMQMNERVWRGFYDIEKLRWDIAYNVRAGTEVLRKYLLRYALKKGENKHRGGLDNLARATYSAYNGGPGQVSRYRNPSAAPSLKKIDAAFWKRYQLVNQGNAMHVARCLGGDAVVVTATIQKPVKPILKNVTSNTDKKKHGYSKKDAGKDWVLTQNENNYTLQLAVFSTLEAAQKLIDEQSLQAVITMYQLGKKNQAKFAVLHGSYRTRSEADKVKKSFKKLKPWVRQFKEIQKTLRP